MKSSNQNDFNRRHFLKLSAALAALAYLPASTCTTTLAKSASDRWGYVLPKRRLGKSGLDATIFALGGGPLNANREEQEAILEAAFRGGCRLFETARSYGTEPHFGRVLKPYRNDIILSSKSRALDADTLNRELDLTLETLQTDYLDIYMMHNVTTYEYLDRKLKGGVWDAMVKAKEEGKVRHLGFSGHANWGTNNEVMDRKLPGLEIMLVPVNVVDTVQYSFTLNTLPKAVEKNIGIIAMKPIGGGGMTGGKITWGQGEKGTVRPAVIPDVITMREAQHFVYSMPVGAVSFGCTSIEHVKEDIELAKSYKGMRKTEQEELMRRVVEIASNNLLEHYKHDDLV